MALSASLTLSPSSAAPHEPVTVIVALSNADGNAWTVNAINLTLGMSDADDAVDGEVGDVYIVPGGLTIPSGGSANPAASVVVDSVGSYTVGAVVLISDGSQVVPTSASLTIA